MNKHWVIVRQLAARDGTAYLNLDSECDGAINLWGNTYESPTYILVTGNQFRLVVFSDSAWADEWMENNAGNYLRVFRIENGEIEEAL